MVVFRSRHAASSNSTKAKLNGEEFLGTSPEQYDDHRTGFKRTRMTRSNVLIKMGVYHKSTTLNPVLGVFAQCRQVEIEEAFDVPAVAPARVTGSHKKKNGGGKRKKSKRNPRRLMQRNILKLFRKSMPDEFVVDALKSANLYTMSLVLMDGRFQDVLKNETTLGFVAGVPAAFDDTTELRSIAYIHPK